VTTVAELHATLTKMITEGKDEQESWIDPPPFAGADATLYAGEDENEPEVASLPVNGPTPGGAG
jgi:hypothetical protein